MTLYAEGGQCDLTALLKREMTGALFLLCNLSMPSDGVK